MKSQDISIDDIGIGPSSVKAEKMPQNIVQLVELNNKEGEGDKNANGQQS